MQKAKRFCKYVAEWIGLWLLYHGAHLLLMPLINFMGWGAAWRPDWFADRIESAVILSGWILTGFLHNKVKDQVQRVFQCPERGQSNKFR